MCVQMVAQLPQMLKSMFFWNVFFTPQAPLRWKAFGAAPFEKWDGYLKILHSQIGGIGYFAEIFEKKKLLKCIFGDI